MGWLDRFFRIREADSTPGREVLGGLTTFLTMAYIIFVNPFFLSKAGIPQEGAIVATCLGAAFGTLAMALLANYPIALAPGMGLNAFFAFTICGAAGVPWQEGLGLVFWCGVIFLVLTLSGARHMIARAVPPVIKLSAAVGIGLFIAFIGLQQGGIVVDHPATLVAMGDLTGAVPVVALVGLAFTLVLIAAKIRTAIFWGMLACIGLGFLTGTVQTPQKVLAFPEFSLPGLEIKIWAALKLKYVPLLLVLVFFDLFDTLGTLMGIAHEGGFLRDGELPRARRAMAADAAGTLAGAFFGTSPVTSYIESGTGVGLGARTGLASVVTGALFLLSLFFVPLAAVVGKGTGSGLNPVTAPALIVVGTLMVKAVREIDWGDMTEAVPAFFTFLLMPLTFNISHGLAAGIIIYVVVKMGARKWRDIHPLMYALAAIFILRYAFLPV